MRNEYTEKLMQGEKWTKKIEGGVENECRKLKMGCKIYIGN